MVELVAYSKQNPDKVIFGSFGVGGDSRLIVEWLKNKTGLQMTHVPYPGAAPALVAFERGDIQLTFPVATAPVLQRWLIAGAKRDPNLSISLLPVGSNLDAYSQPDIEKEPGESRQSKIFGVCMAGMGGRGLIEACVT